MSNGFGTVTFCALLIAICMSSETAADNRNRHVIDGFAGIEFGSKVDRYSDAGSSKVIDTGRRVLEWQKPIRPLIGFPDLKDYFVRYNPRDKSIYHVQGEWRLPFGVRCKAMIQRAAGFLLKEFPAHPFNTDEESVFVVGQGSWRGTDHCRVPRSRTRLSGLWAR